VSRLDGAILTASPQNPAVLKLYYIWGLSVTCSVARSPSSISSKDNSCSDNHRSERGSAAAQHHGSLMINEFVLSVMLAFCQPRSLLIKLPLVNALNTDWWMSMPNEGLLDFCIPAPPPPFFLCERKTYTRVLLTRIECSAGGLCPHLFQLNLYIYHIFWMLPVGNNCL